MSAEGPVFIAYSLYPPHLRKQVEDIAKLKLPDLNAESLQAAVNTVKGTARSMGVDVV